MFYSDDLYSLYIHWPFCSSKCYYCDFVALEQHEDFQTAYHAALLKEIKLFSEQNPSYNKNITTIFIGGGTPSLYPIELMEELFTLLRRLFNFDNLTEICMEANPADITEERLDAWDSFGIDRISMGVQVLDDNALLKLNRRQRTRDVEQAARIIPKYFDNYSMDLILGLPNVSEKSWFETVNRVIAFKPQHISLYFLTVHEKTPLYFKVQKNTLTLPDEELIIKHYDETITLLEKNGFQQYEISNFAQPGHESQHNQAYWERKPYKGFGIGACSFDGKRRFTNEKNLEHYVKSLLNDNKQAICFQEELSLQQEKIEQFMLILRQNKGGDLQRMVYLLDEHERAAFCEKINLFEKQGLLINNGGIIQLTRKGMILENEIVMQLI